MTPIISAIADGATSIYIGRAFLSAMADTPRMENNDWRARLAKALDDTGRTMRDVSLKAKVNPGYIHSILKEGKDPSVEKLMAVCKEIGASPTYILYGVDVQPEDAEIIGAMREDPATRDAVLSLLRRRIAGPV